MLKIFVKLYVKKQYSPKKLNIFLKPHKKTKDGKKNQDWCSTNTYKCIRLSD